MHGKKNPTLQNPDFGKNPTFWRHCTGVMNLHSYLCGPTDLRASTQNDVAGRSLPSWPVQYMYYYGEGQRVRFYLDSCIVTQVAGCVLL